MAQMSPLFSAGSTCDFCNAAPATLVARGHRACERHKNSEIVELGFSRLTPSSASRSGGVKKSGSDDDDDEIEVWEPLAVMAGWSRSSPPPNLSRVWGAINGSSSPNGSSPRRISSSGSGSRPNGGSSVNALLVAASALGSPAVPLPVFSGSSSDDDVEVVGISHGPGVAKLTGASPPALPLGAEKFGADAGGGGGGGGSGDGSKSPKAIDRVYRNRPRRPAELTGPEIVDLVTAAALPAVDVGPSAPRAKRRHSTPGEIGATGSDRQEQQRRRSGSGEAATEDAPITAQQGKGKRRKSVRPEVQCIVCFDSSPLSRSARCAEGHAMCKTCVTSYVTETLMPQGTVFWDRIKCGGSSTCGHLFGPSVTSLLPRPVVRKVEIKQMDVAHLVAGERDPTSDKWISKHSKDCPNCSVPIQKSSGCNHMTCVMCRHNFWYKCDCKYPKHEGECRRRY